MKALVNYKIAEEFERKTGIEAIALNPYTRLAKPVASHPDMLFCVLDKTVFCYKDYMLENNLCDVVSREGYSINFVSNTCSMEYPNDIALNVLVMGKDLLCNTRHTAPEILDYAKKHGYCVHNVNQGYSACSTLIIDENTAITSDMGISSAIKSLGKKVLIIKNEDIVLPGYDCGFIGGASGKIGESVYFFGDIDTLQDGKTIFNLLREKNLSIKSISSGRVYDFGGIKLI